MLKYTVALGVLRLRSLGSNSPVFRIFISRHDHLILLRANKSSSPSTIILLLKVDIVASLYSALPRDYHLRPTTFRASLLTYALLVAI